ncbi:MAG: helix-turn-helix transcriptional regulator [Blastocatellia bacterium]|nr:helix-turn-helix transcriptional regulator [Blastocatellia bacterium]
MEHRAVKKFPEKLQLSAKRGIRPNVAEMVESVVGCKWSLKVLSLVKEGVCRPGAMVRSADGLTTKVLNERLRKMVNFGILEKVSYPEIPPRVEYVFTPFGEKFLKLLESIEELEASLSSSAKS